MSTVIMIANQKGGVGKTSTAIELCTIFARKNKVLGIDLDGQKNFSIYAGADTSSEKPNIYNALNAECPVEDAIQSLMSFDMIASDSKLSLAQKHFISGDDQYLLADIIEMLPVYDFIFIDCPPQRGILQEMAIVASDYCIGVTKVDDGGLLGLLELNADIELKHKRNNSHVKMLGILYNDFLNTNEDVSSIATLDDIAKKMNTKVFDTIIRHSIKASSCKKHKMALVELDKDNNVAKDYEELAKEIKSILKAKNN